MEDELSSRQVTTAHASTVTKVYLRKPRKNVQNHGAPRARRIAPQPRASVERRSVGNNIESRLIDEFTPAAASRRRLICKSELGQEANDRGAVEVPLRSPTQISGGPEGGVDGPRWTRGAAGT
ncbi:hypothetical protein THAOC_09139 [Thalassiosira oceanica]|uniref:Uncharacterized protein n=1 Tax=Thalassiosira oceanica TaxID=159749 RepID=K0T8B1_THAOC|nr:hypothetical protein THAOC_09139 [Thalassiosira oceanica]|eukprot:EJK69586.1 hypothetical protein THAOC_09139 [Thalassiosira oceanica]